MTRERAEDILRKAFRSAFVRRAHEHDLFDSSLSSFCLSGVICSASASLRCSRTSRHVCMAVCVYWDKVSMHTQTSVYLVCLGVWQPSST